MKQLMNRNNVVVGVLATLGLCAIALLAPPALAQDKPVDAAALQKEMQYVFNTLLFLIGGFLVMWMAAGFAMLEAGMVRSKNVSMQCTKNIALFAIAGIVYWAVGYNIMYDGVDGGFIGSISPKIIPEPDKDAGGYAAASDWFFQMVFCATAASIVSGTMAERIKLWPFLVFVVILCGFIYPIQGAWKWGAGWLASGADVSWIKSFAGAEFQDFAGSTLVHSTGGWAALFGAIILGARKGKYGANGRCTRCRAQHAACNTWHVHLVAWLVRLQRRVAASDGNPHRRVVGVEDLHEHQPFSLRRCHRSNHPEPAVLRQS